MSVKLLVIGDIHWRATNPVARLDNFKEALTAKIGECWDLAKTYQVDGIIQTGDFFHSPGVVYSTLADLIHLLRQAPAPVYSIPGNHDLFAASPESLYRTPLGFLFQVGMLRNLDGKSVSLHDANHSSFVTLSGRGYDASTDVDPNIYAPLQEATDLVRVHVTHGMLVQEAVPGRHTLMRSLLELEHAPEVLINGHFHLGTGISQVGPTLVVNPGALCRISAHMEEINRRVQVALVNIEGRSCSAELVPLKSVRPGAEVISRAHLETQAQAERRRDEFLRLLAAEETERVLDLAEMVKSIASREKLPDKVQEEALRRIAKAQEAMVS